MKITKRSKQLTTLYLSSKDKEIYESVISRKHLSKNNIKDLYVLNLFLSQELYIVVNLIETLYKNKLHQKMKEVEGTENWFNTISWRSKEYDILKETAHRKYIIKAPIRILDELTLKFWLQTLETHYENILFKPAIQHMFPNYKGKEPLKRSTLKQIFSEVQNYRNTISHHHIIIHEERKLIKCYYKFLHLIKWMDTDYYKLVVRHSRFLRYFSTLTTSSYNVKGVLWFVWRRIRRFFMKYVWNAINLANKNK